MSPLALPLFEIGKKLIDRIVPDPEGKSRAELELLKLQQDGQFRELEAKMQAIIAEAKSSDPWTSRARPSFLYVIYIFILSSIPMGVLFAAFPDVATDVTTGVKLWLKTIPGELYTLFGAGYLGYAHYRSADKKGLKK